MTNEKEKSAMAILIDFAKPCKGKLLGSVVLAVLGAFCGMIPYIAVSRGIILICHGDYDVRRLVFVALIALAGYLGQLWLGTFSTMKSHESAFIILKNIRTTITAKLSGSSVARVMSGGAEPFRSPAGRVPPVIRRTAPPFLM